jgi:hypothetical protein
MTLDPVAHALLEFRQDCPLCRAARHAGPLPRSDMVPPRARAAVVAAVVTGSTVLPASALAHGGGPSTGAVQEVADDEGGVATEATTTAVETEYNLPAPPAAPDMPPLPGGSVVPPGHGGTPPGHADDPVAPPSSSPSSEGSESSPTVTAPAGGSPEGNEPDPAEAPPAPSAEDVPDAGNPVGGGHGTPAGGGGGAPSVPVGGGSPAAPTPPQVDVPPTAPSVDQGDGTAAPAAPSAGGDSRDASASLPDDHIYADASQGGKSGGGGADSSGGASNSGGPASGGASAVTVQSGDSLWLVAEQQLGAGASVADVAAYVNELWDLNADAIGTGDPNLIMPGQTLQLPG